MTVSYRAAIARQFWNLLNLRIRCLRTQFYLLTLICLLVLGVSCGCFFLQTPGVTGRNALRLSEGMSEERIERIFGLPGVAEECPLSGYYIRVWTGNSIRIKIIFSQKGEMSLGYLYQSLRDGSIEVPLVPSPYGYRLSFIEKVYIWFGIPLVHGSSP